MFDPDRLSYGEVVTKLEPDEVFVFGANMQGFHGGGAAGFASFGVSGNRWREFDYADKPNGWKGKWNIKGQAEGLQEGTEGKSYALPTVWQAGQRRSLTREEIIASIQKMYSVAQANSQWKFLVAGSSVVGKTPLNGYSHEEMCAMYEEAGDIPNNVIFSDSYAKIILSFLLNKGQQT